MADHPDDNIADVDPKPKAEKATRYKVINLYDPAIKRSRAKAIKRDLFTTEAELTAYCEKLKAENKIKNAEYKKQQQLNKLAPPVPAAEQHLDQHPLGIVEVGNKVPDLVKQLPPISSKVTLDLDKKSGNTIAIYGASKRGKSTLMMYLYKKYFAEPDSIDTLFTPNYHIKVYKGCPKLIIAHGFNQQHAEGLQIEHAINGSQNNKYKFCNLFDDVVDAKYSQTLKDMILTYRNANISMIICLQYNRDLSKSNRGSVNHTFIFGTGVHEDAKNNVELLLKSYFIPLGYRTLDDMIQFYQEMTKDHGFIHIDNKNATISFHRLDISKLKGKK